MSKFRKLLLPLCLMTVFFLVSGCSDDDSPTVPGGGGGGGGGDAPTFNAGIATYTPPTLMQNSADPGATQSKIGIALVNSAPTFGNFLVPPTKSDPELGEKAGPWVQTWAIGGGQTIINVTMTITEIDGVYRWEYVVSGTDGENTYTNVLLYAAEAATDGSSGWLEFYDGPGEVAVMRWNFMVSGGVTTSEVLFLDGSDSSRLILVTNTDGSGSLDTYTGLPWTMEFAASWNAAGVGTWTEYNPNGSVSDSGGWGAPTAKNVLTR